MWTSTSSRSSSNIGDEAAYVVEVGDVAPLHLRVETRHPLAQLGEHPLALGYVAHDQAQAGPQPAEPSAVGARGRRWLR